MTGQSIDRRVARTQDRLHQALRRLLERTRYERITVQALCRAAGVGRSTFYANFNGKDDLRRHAVDRLGQALAAAEPVGDLLAFPFCETLFEHAATHRRQLCTSGAARDRVRSILARRFCHELLASGGECGDRTDVEARVTFYVAGLLGLLDWWLDEGARRSPQEMATLFRALAAGQPRTHLDRDSAKIAARAGH